MVGTGGPAVGQTGPNVNTNEPESMKKLRALKEKIQAELQQEQRERQDLENREPMIPLSLAADHATSGAASGKKVGARAIRQQVEKLVAQTKEKIGPAVKTLDKHLQRDLDSELERKALETVQLKSHNNRLRDIITLRQESNTRREERFESEIERLKELADTSCVTARGYQQTMDNLKSMNRQVQEDAVRMKQHIEEQAEAERLALIRTYRVRMREVKLQLKQQEEANLEGASAWIRRFSTLDADRQVAETNLKALQQKMELLTTDNAELRVMRKHQEEQRNALAQKIGMLKRENKRFEEHITKLQSQLQGNAPADPFGADDYSGSSRAVGTPLRAARSRGGGASSNSPSQLPPNDAATISRRQTQALNKIRVMLNTMRNSLRKIRSAHVELLQERSELEMFLRQCIEDVRRDMYRFTVVNNTTRTLSHDGKKLEDTTLLEDYGVKDRKKLLDILNSKLEVLTLLLEKMFPGRVVQGGEPLGEYLKSEMLLSAEESRGSSVESSTALIEAKVPPVHEMDELWDRWKQWTRSVTPNAE